jgi:hypothetical protein
MSVTDLIHKELNRLAPELTAPELATHTAAIAQCNAYREQDGKLVPTSREAVASIVNFAPPSFVRGIAREVSDAQAEPAARVLKYFEALGSNWEAAIEYGIARASGQDPAPGALAAANAQIAAQRVVPRDGK